MKTKAIKKSEIERSWHLLDAKGEVLGRLGTQIAFFLMGKNKPYYSPHLDCGDYVVLINADKIKVTGRKEQQKIYYHHSGYPGGFKEIPFNRLMEKNPAKIVQHAVTGMLPKNKLREGRMKRLKIFKGRNHPYEDKLKNAKKKN